MVQCPICDFTGGKFEPFGKPPRENAKCPKCGSLERHRLIWRFIKKRKLIDAKTKLLHFSPQICFIAPLKEKLGKNYVTSNIIPEVADLTMDMTDMKQVRARSFNAVIANHVLEHVQDDRKALSEVRRILQKGGWAIFTVPLFKGKTMQNAEAKPPHGHLRNYGKEDFVNLLKSSKLHVETVEVSQVVNDEERQTFVTGGNAIFFCTRK